MLSNTSLHSDHSAEFSLKNEETQGPKPRDFAVETRLELALRDSRRLMEMDFKPFRDQLLLIQYFCDNADSRRLSWTPSGWK